MWLFSWILFYVMDGRTQHNSECLQTAALGSWSEIASLQNQNVYGSGTNQVMAFSGIYKKIVVGDGVCKLYISDQSYVLCIVYLIDVVFEWAHNTLATI